MVTWNFVLGSSFGSNSISTAMQNQIRAGLDAAGQIWSRYLGPSNVTITVDVDVVDFGPMSGTLAQAGASGSAFGGDPFESDVTKEIRTGVDQNGGASDAFIDISLRSLQDGEFFFDPDPLARTANVPFFEFDFVSVMIHELGHPLGFLGDGSNWVFDQFLSGGAFQGAKTVAFFGGAPAMEVASSHFDQNLFLPSPNGGLQPIMNPFITNGERGYVTPADVLVLDDIGLTLPEPSNGDDTIWGFDAFNDDVNLLGGNDLFIGVTGNDTINGGGGADIIKGGGGADQVNGGSGADFMSYLDAAGGVTVNLAAGSASGNIATGDTLINIENLFGSSFSDNITGSSGANNISSFNGDDTISGGAGNDTISGGNGDDVISAENGNDLIFASQGADIIDGGDGIDNLNFSGAAAQIIVNLGSGAGSGDLAEGDQYTNIEDVVGSNFGDLIFGSSVANRLNGGNGDDVIKGAGGADRINGANGFDTAGFLDATTGITVNLSTGVSSGSVAAGDQLISIERVFGSNSADTVTGSSAGESVVGFGGNDVISLGGGDDTLQGGVGADTLTGGTGADQFVFAIGEGGDTITDFAAGVDVIQILSFGPAFDSFSEVIGAATQTGAGAEFDFNGDTFLLSGVNVASLSAGDFVF
ncbi:MAG: hypothetical protein AAGB02_05480 [Pseudomonadota bacterium]